MQKIWITVSYTWNEYNVVNQVYFNFKIEEKKRGLVVGGGLFTGGQSVWGELVKEGRKEGSLNSIVSLKLWVQSKTKQNSGNKQRMLRVVRKVNLTE